MRKIIGTLLLSFITFIPCFAQDQLGLASLGVNLSYGTKIETMGVGIRAQYGFSEHVSAIGEYKYYLDRKNWTEWEFNIDLHYLYEISPFVSLYPLAGVKVSRWTYDPGYPLERFKKSFNRIGLNIGAGSQIALDYNIYLQPEIKYELTKDYSQFVFSAGIMYIF